MAALSGAALILLMLLDWFGGANAWQLKLVDVLLLAIAVLAVGLAARHAAGDDAGRAAAVDPGRATTTGLALTVTGAVAVGVMLTLVLESSGGTVPLVLSLVAAAGILGGGLLAMRGGGPSRVSRSGPGGAPPTRA